MIFSRPLNIFWQELNWLSHAILIVLMSDVNSYFTTIFSVINSPSFIWILEGKGVNPSFIIGCNPLAWIFNVIKLFAFNLLNSIFLEENACDKKEKQMIRNRIKEYNIFESFLIFNFVKDFEKELILSLLYSCKIFPFICDLAFSGFPFIYPKNLQLSFFNIEINSFDIYIKFYFILINKNHVI